MFCRLTLVRVELGSVTMSNRQEASKYRRNAQDHFTQAEKRDSTLKQEQEKVRLAEKAKTARLRALRLAKEAEDAAGKEKIAK